MISGIYRGPIKKYRGKKALLLLYEPDCRRVNVQFDDKGLGQRAYGLTPMNKCDFEINGKPAQRPGCRTGRHHYTILDRLKTSIRKYK